MITTGLRHFTAFQKWAFFWMPDKHVAQAETLGSGKYKLFAQDKVDAINNNNNYLLVMVSLITCVLFLTKILYSRGFFLLYIYIYSQLFFCFHA